MTSLTEIKVINVQALGMDARKLAIFRMAFKMHALQQYRLLDDVPGAVADLAIADIDGVDGAGMLFAFRREHPDLPIVLVTIDPAGLPAIDPPLPVLVKPVRIETLFPLLRQALDEPIVAKPPSASPPAASSVAPLAPAVSGSSPIAEKPLPSLATAPAATVIPSPPPAATVTPPPPPPAAASLPERIERFNPQHGLLGVLLEIQQLKRPSMVSIDNRAALVVLPDGDHVRLLQNLDVLKDACLSVKIAVSHRPLNAGEFPSGATDSDIDHPLMPLLWQVALWSSRGRLLDNLSLTAPLRLRHWPNLTRLVPIPGAMRISAFLVRSPADVRLAIRMLNVPAEVLSDFLAATYSIGILDTGASRPTDAPVDTAAMPPPPLPLPLPTATRGGLLSRLLRKVIGL